MRQLVVLVGLPGSGKTAFQREHPEWVVVSRGAIREWMFRGAYDRAHEDTVDRVFQAALVEALDSPTEIVCVDEPNLTRAERLSLVELAQLAGREPHAHVLPMTSPDALYERMERNRRRLGLEKPYLRLRSFPRKAYAELVSRYEPIDREEGFASVTYGAETASPYAGSGVVTKGKPAPARDPLPLFTV
jgi:predicted kinase